MLVRIAAQPVLQHAITSQTALNSQACGDHSKPIMLFPLIGGL